MQIPVVKRYSKTEFDVIFLRIEDVLFMRSFKGSVYYQTAEGLFPQVSTFEEHERMLAAQGFRKVDRCYAVNMDNAEYFDEGTKRIFFEPEPASKGAVYAPVSAKQRKDVIIPNSTGQTCCQGKFIKSNVASENL